MNKSNSRAYLAGIIDGEGTIAWNHNRGYAGAPGSMNVTVASTTTDLMKWILEFAGGRHSERPEWTKAGDRARIGSKPCYCWKATGERAAIVVRGTLPWLIVKREKAREVLGLWDASYAQLQRTKRRDFHRVEARADMRDRGWNVDADLFLWQLFNLPLAEEAI